MIGTISQGRPSSRGGGERSTITPWGLARFPDGWPTVQGMTPSAALCVSADETRFRCSDATRPALRVGLPPDDPPPERCRSALPQVAMITGSELPG
jgi:hypothetical protein